MFQLIKLDVLSLFLLHFIDFLKSYCLNSPSPAFLSTMAPAPYVAYTAQNYSTKGSTPAISDFEFMRTGYTRPPHKVLFVVQSIICKSGISG